MLRYIYTLTYLVERMNQHLGKETQEYVNQTAFEYQQSDFHYFKIHSVDYKPKIENTPVVREQINETLSNVFKV